MPARQSFIHFCITSSHRGRPSHSGSSLSGILYRILENLENDREIAKDSRPEVVEAGCGLNGVASSPHHNSTFGTTIQAMSL
jgi:hypothetical protein